MNPISKEAREAARNYMKGCHVFNVESLATLLQSALDTQAKRYEEVVNAARCAVGNKNFYPIQYLTEALRNLDKQTKGAK